MNIFLDDSKCSEQLRPFSLTCHVGDYRVGILTIKEKWQALDNYIVFTEANSLPEDAITVNANYIPTKQNHREIIKYARDKVAIMETDEVKVLSYPWQLFEYNAWAIEKDFELLNLTDKRADGNGNSYFGSNPIYIHETATVLHSTLNSTEGPIYVGEGAIIMEGSMIRGAVSIGKNAVVKMGTKIYGATSIGNYCVTGGEIKNSILFGYSNKAHDGYLGDSVLGYYCNIGAGSSNSNVKNTLSAVAYNIDGKEVIGTGNIKGGLLMGDYSRCAINTSFTTAAVVEPCCHIFGAEEPEKYYPAFTWGNTRYKLDQAIEHITAWKKMKGKDITDKEIDIITKLFNYKK